MNLDRALKVVLCVMVVLYLAIMTAFFLTE